MAACVSVLLAVVGATDYEEGSFAGLAPKATAHFADEFDERRGLRAHSSACVALLADALLAAAAAACSSLPAVAGTDRRLGSGTRSGLVAR